MSDFNELPATVFYTQIIYIIFLTLVFVGGLVLIIIGILVQLPGILRTGKLYEPLVTFELSHRGEWNKYITVMPFFLLSRNGRGNPLSAIVKPLQKVAQVHPKDGDPNAPLRNRLLGYWCAAHGYFVLLGYLISDADYVIPLLFGHGWSRYLVLCRMLLHIFVLHQHELIYPAQGLAFALCVGMVDWQIAAIALSLLLSFMYSSSKGKEISQWISLLALLDPLVTMSVALGLILFWPHFLGSISSHSVCRQLLPVQLWSGTVTFTILTVLTLPVWLVPGAFFLVSHVALIPAALHCFSEPDAVSTTVYAPFYLIIALIVVWHRRLLLSVKSLSPKRESVNV